MINNSNILDSVLISTQALTSNGFGNAFSYYINTLSCAQLSKMHFRWRYDFFVVTDISLVTFVKKVLHVLDFIY